MISIIILNWNGKKITEACLDSIKKQTSKDYEVILIDNASTDGSSKYLKKKFPFIKLIQNKKNLGYAGGNNLGVKQVKGDYILILNNDVVLDKNFLKELWINRKKADILGVKNYYFDKKNVIWTIGSKVNKFTMKAKLMGKGLVDSGNIDKIKIDHAVGSAMLINRKVIDKIGFLNENYFAYYEETEWQTRAQKSEFKISWVPTAKLWHKVGFSTGGGRTPLSAYYLVRNRGYFIKRWAKYKLIAYLIWLIEIIMRVIYGLIKNYQYAKMSFRGMIDFFMGKKGKFI
jgi:GT2 family glycosyltransferase